MEQKVSRDNPAAFGFPNPSYEEWRQQASGELKGKAFDSLFRRTEEELINEPFYSADHQGPLWSEEDIERKYLFRLTGSGWQIRQDFAGNADALRKHMFDALEGGITAVGIGFQPSSFEAFSKLLEGVWIEMVQLHFTSQDDPLTILQWLDRLASERGVDSKQIQGSLAVSGVQNLSHADRDEILRLARDRFPLFRPFTVDAWKIRDNGGNAVQEIAYALASGQEILHHLSESGIPVDDAAAMILFHLGVGSDYFGEIVKFRAFRRLWIEVIRAYQPIHSCTSYATIHAGTTQRTLADKDIHTNLLRTTTEAMSAIVGGVDSLTVAPSDILTGEISAESLRWARNIQHLLCYESGFDQVIDPAAGSWFMETYAHQMAEKAWELFLHIESKGGIGEWGNGFDELVQSSAQRGLDELAAGKKIKVGWNKYEVKE